MRVKIAKQTEKFKVAAANAKSLAQFEGAIHKIEDIDAFIRLDKGGSSDINADHMEDRVRRPKPKTARLPWAGVNACSVCIY